MFTNWPSKQETECDPILQQMALFTYTVYISSLLSSVYFEISLFPTKFFQNSCNERLRFPYFPCVLACSQTAYSLESKPTAYFQGEKC